MSGLNRSRAALGARREPTPLDLLLLGPKARVAAMAGSFLTRDLALDALVETRNADDYPLVDATADRLDRIARFHSERDGAAFHAQKFTLCWVDEFGASALLRRTSRGAFLAPPNAQRGSDLFVRTDWVYADAGALCRWIVDGWTAADTVRTLSDQANTAFVFGLQRHRSHARQAHFDWPVRVI